MKSIKDNLVFYRMAYLYAGLFSVNALACAITASFMNVEWSDLSATSKFLLVVVVLQNMSGTLLAFLNKTMARIQDGGPLIQVEDVPKPEPKQP